MQGVVVAGCDVLRGKLTKGDLVGIFRKGQKLKEVRDCKRGP